jgi:hypothetical protein
MIVQTGDLWQRRAGRPLFGAGSLSSRVAAPGYCPDLAFGITGAIPGDGGHTTP